MSPNHYHRLSFTSSLVILVFLVPWASGRAQEPFAQRHVAEVRAVDDIATIELPPIDLEAIAAEDVLREQEGLPPRFAIPNLTAITPATDGTWEALDNNMLMWRLRIQAAGALSVNVGFTRYVMPDGGTLYVYATDGNYVVRPFTAEDNELHGELWTPPVLSDDIIVEVTVPAEVAEHLELEFGSINHGYRGFGETRGLRSGSCNVDVVCPQGDDWRDDISTVGVISTGGSTFCTGFMVNNTAEDLTPYFMTADHCSVGPGNAASLVVFWNYENSWCRPPGSAASGGPGDGSLSQFNTGSFFRADYGSSDMTLVELDDDPNPAWNVGYAGWDRSSADASSAVAIHHPNTDEKRISFEDQGTQTTSYLGTTPPGNGTHVRVIDWDLGTTEPGSSGSPLFDQNHRVVGQLHGGYAACGNDDSDWYGRFSVSWDGGGTSSTRLRDWLDPGNTGAMTTDFVSLNTLCSDVGEVEFAEPKYACEDSATVKVVDCGLDLNETVVDTVTITVASDSEPGGEMLVLTETRVDSAKFEAVLSLSGTNAAGVLQVAEGDLVSATYVDADDGEGNFNVVVIGTAVVDCTPPVISNVQTVNVQPRTATVTFNASEASKGGVSYGFSCGSLPGTAAGTTYGTSVAVDLASLQDGTTYFYAVEAEDEAGNLATDNNGGACYTFATPEVPEFFTEEFVTDNDLDSLTLLFSLSGTFDYYDGCAESITALPTDPSGGTIMSLTDDESELVAVGGGNSVSLYGVSYNSFYVGANGFITFGSSDSDYDETLAEHFELPRVAALYDDLNPTAGGQVSWKQLADRMVVTWDGVPEYNTTSFNTFQVELYFDGRIRLSYLAVGAADGIAGLSRGDGLSPDFFESDLSAMGSCGPKAPAAAAAPHDVLKNRYISFAPNNGTRAVAFRVELAECDYFPGSTGVLGWVGKPDVYGIARVVSGRVDQMWPQAVIHVGDCEIAPNAYYQVRAILAGADAEDPGNFSDPLEIPTTPKPGTNYWADAVGSLVGVCSVDGVTPCISTVDCPAGQVCGIWPGPDGVLNFDDVGAAVKAFQRAPGTVWPEVTWVDIHGDNGGDATVDPPNRAANFADIQFMVLAFQGNPYPFSDPADCP